MPVARTRSVALLGLTGSVVEVEADLSSQLPGFVIIGLPDAALAEARERVRSAAVNAGCPLPQRKLTVNLSPAALPKHGSGFDLAIAIACLAAAGEVSAESVDRVVHLGELGLDGRLRPIDGILPAVLAAARAGHDTVMVPTANAAEAALVPGVEVIGVASLLDAAIWHGGEYDDHPVEPVPALTPHRGDGRARDRRPRRRRGQRRRRRGAPHGRRRRPPPVPARAARRRQDHARVATARHPARPRRRCRTRGLRRSARSPGERSAPSSRTRPPFEAPHHTATAAAIVGGGSRVIRPGAAARASHGVLFLDEAPEFPAAVLDVLRQPLESGTISIHRANAVASLPGAVPARASPRTPARAAATASRRPTAPVRPSTRRRYLARISGPLLDRIDLQVRVPRITIAGLRMHRQSRGMSSAEARAQGGRRHARVAAGATARHAVAHQRRDAGAVDARRRRPASRRPGRRPPLDRALERGGITMRGYDRVLKIAWTIADLDGAATPRAEHVGRALFLRKGITI